MSNLIERASYEAYLGRREWRYVLGAHDALARLGLFDDGLSCIDLDHVLNDTRWVTPTEHLAPEGVVLCTTGAFSPLHSGHIDMLKYAKEQLEAKGRKVAGAMIQPDHDQYVSSKPGAARCAADRIHWAQEMTKDIPWIAVDPWPSVYQDRALNYTTILRRTERYLKRFGQYEVVYVFGSDNEGFKDAFLPHEYVCVPRTAISSTEVRKTMEWPVWEGPTYEKPYLIRDDLDWATEQWGVYPRAVTVFWADLQAAICGAISSSPSYVASEEQQAQLAKLTQPFVSFDRITGSHHWVSRVFNACTHQYKPVDWLSSDLFSIPPGEYALVDDDIASGTTVEYIKWRTPQVKWTETISMTKWSIPSFFDIVDARDFLFGARLGGLCIKNDNHVYRAPYILPWVNLTQRAKIPPAKQAAFTKAIIEANVRFFEACDPAITVGDTDNMAFWYALGYSQDHSMRYVCKDLLGWNPNI